MAENNRDAGKQSKKDAKRDAKIEAKRRKLAEQRAERMRNSAGTGTARAGESAPGHTAEKLSASENISRPVTADSGNKSYRLRITENESAANSNAASSKGKRKSPAAQELINRRKAAARKSKSGGNLSGVIGRIREGKIPPSLIIKAAAALLIVIFIIYAIAQVTDYYNKKPEYTVTDEGFDHAVMFDGSIPLNGIDISEHQGDDINWDKVKSSGIDFVFIRAGYRASDDGSLRKDKLFEKNAREASKAGLMVGAYFYSQALNAVEGKEEAEYLLEAVKDFDITMPLVIDYEIYKDGRLDLKIQAGEMYAASFYHDAVLGFTHTVEAAGYESAVYASQDMLTNYMQADIIDDMATIWLAKYDRGAYLDANYWFWQCSDTGRAGGIKGKVDQNFWYMEPEKVYETRAKHSKSAVSIGKCRISFKRSKAKLHNFRAEPNYAMTYEGMGMTEGRDYVASVVHNIQEGTGYIIIRGIGKYKDWIMYPFAIE